MPQVVKPLEKLRKELGDRVVDKSTLYPDHKDLNDYLVSISPKHTNKIKILINI